MTIPKSIREDTPKLVLASDHGFELSRRDERCLSPQNSLNNLARFGTLELSYFALFLFLYFSSQILFSILRKCTSTSWQRCLAVFMMCFFWVGLFGVPSVRLGYFDFDTLAKISNGLKKLSTEYQFLHGFKVQPLWIQIYFWSIPVWTVFRFWSRAHLQPKADPVKHLNPKGYVVLSQEKEFEHRAIAKQMLGRNLERNEIVHHVNGIPTDNEIGNLCLMDHEKHEHFHAWLRWKKEKSGNYPSIDQQKRVLEEEYGGTLLENLVSMRRAKS